MNAAGIALDEFNKQVANTQNGLPILEAYADAARMNGDITAAQSAAIKQFVQDQVEVYAKATEAQAWFSGALDTTNRSVAAVGDAMDAGARSAERAATATGQRGADAARHGCRRPSRHRGDAGAVRTSSTRCVATCPTIRPPTTWPPRSRRCGCRRWKPKRRSRTTPTDAADALRKEATDTIALKEKIVDYGTAVLGLPASQVTKIVAEVDDTQLDQLEKRLARIKANAVINAQIIDRGGAGYAPPTRGRDRSRRWLRRRARRGGRGSTVGGDRWLPRRRTTRPATCRRNPATWPQPIPPADPVPAGDGVDDDRARHRRRPGGGRR